MFDVNRTFYGRISARRRDRRRWREVRISEMGYGTANVGIRRFIFGIDGDRRVYGESRGFGRYV